MPTESSTETVAIQRAQCRHIFTDGHRCGSPCLNKEIFCYYHHATRKPAPRTHRTPAGTRHLPIPEDRPSLLLSIGHVIQAIASKTIDRKDASLLLYAFQVASSALPRDNGAAPGRRAQPRGSVREAPAPSLDDSAAVPAAVYDIVQGRRLP